MSARTRLYFLVLGVVGLITGLVLLVAPDQTSDYFVWPAGPAATARFMGAGYLATGLTLLGALVRLRSWQKVRLLFPPVGLFALIMLAATGLHADRFFWDRPQTWLWSSLYVVIVVAAVLLPRWERVPSAGSLAAPDSLPIGVRLALGGAGLGMGAWAAALFLAPPIGASLWPWQLTPLTGRVVAGWIVVGAALAVGGALSGDRVGVRLPLRGWMLTVLLFLAAGVASWNAFSPQDPRTWLYFGALGMSIPGAWLVLRA